MLYIYSITPQDVAVDAPIQFANIGLSGKCRVAIQRTETTAQINAPGVYKITFNGTAAAATTAQLFVNGQAYPGALSTGTSLSFSALVRVNPNCCAVTNNLPIRIQVRNGATAATYNNAALTITKEDR